MKKRHSRNTNSAESGEIVGQALISQKCKRSSNVVENNGHCWVLSNILDGLIASATYANGVWVAIPEISKTGDLYHYKDDKVVVYGIGLRYATKFCSTRERFVGIR